MRIYKICFIFFAPLLICSCTQNDLLQIEPNAKIVASYKAINDTSGLYQRIDPSVIKVSFAASKKFKNTDSIRVFDVDISNISGYPWQGIIKFDLQVQTENPWFLMPGFIYGDNHSFMDTAFMQKLWPRLVRGKQEVPYSDFFRVRADRLSYPVSALCTNDHVYGISGSPYIVNHDNEDEFWFPGIEGDFVQYNGFGCEMDSSFASVSYTLGYENAPWLYVGGKNILPARVISEGSYTIEAGENLSLKLYVYAYKADDRRALNYALKDQFTLFHEEPRKVVSLEQGALDLSEALFLHAYDKEAKNYATVTRLVDGKVERDQSSFSIGWTGGMVVATPLLHSAIRLGREDMRHQALECIQDIVDHSLNEKSGLLFDAKVDGEWTTNGWWEFYIWGPVEGVTGHSSYLTGQALFYILKAYELEKKYKNIEHKDWLDFVVKVSNRVEETINEEHEYPYRWSKETGEAIDYNSMGGAWCLATRAYLASILNDSTMLKESEISIDHYWNKFVKQMNCYGTPHDVWMATEEEGVLAFVKAAAILHQITGEEKYLTYLRDGIDYEFTWKYCYNTIVLVPPLSKLNWSSSGASGTSVANPHVHPMGSLIVDDVLYYSEISNDKYYHQRAKDIVGWSLQSYNRYDGEFDHGLKGWMSERYCPHQGLLIEKYPNGNPASTWFVYHSWASGCVLDAIAGEAWDEF